MLILYEITKERQQFSEINIYYASLCRINASDTTTKRATNAKNNNNRGAYPQRKRRVVDARDRVTFKHSDYTEPEMTNCK